MRPKFLVLVGALVVIIAVGILCWFRASSWFFVSKANRESVDSGTTGTSAPSGNSSASKVPSVQAVEALSAKIDALCSELKASKDPKTTRAILVRLRNLLDSQPPELASWAIQAFLASNHDAPTNLDITIKPGGELGDASSMRVFLLDYLGQVDKQAAGAVAMQVLAQYTTPDEWAVSLRNYAWANLGPGSQDFLKKKTAELLANPAWLKDPSTGFLEAFDTIVYTKDTSLTPALSALVRDKDNRATAYAAYLTLDRLVLDEPVPMLKTLVTQPDLLVGGEQTRANYVARADLGQPDQRALVEQYLLGPTRNAQELNTFAALYPNDNYMISDNLLTQVQTPSGATLFQRDKEALATVEQWQKDPRFQGLKPLLAQMHQRIGTLVQEASSGGH